MGTERLPELTRSRSRAAAQPVGPSLCFPCLVGEHSALVSAYTCEALLLLVVYKGL